MSKISRDDANAELSLWEARKFECFDSFINMLVDSFDIRLSPDLSQASTKLKNIHNPDILMYRIGSYRQCFSEQICPDDTKKQFEVIFLLEFIEMLFKMFNKYFSFNIDEQEQVRDSFRRDVVFKIFQFGLCLISESRTSLTTKNIKSFKSEQMIDYLSFMFNKKYIENSKSNSISWLEHQNNKLIHGVGGEIKRFTSRYKNEKSIKTLGSVSYICQFLEDELSSRRSKEYIDYPSLTEFNLFLSASIAIQHIQKHVNFNTPKIKYFDELIKDITRQLIKSKNMDQFKPFDDYSKVDFDDLYNDIELIFRKQSTIFLKEVIGPVRFKEMLFKFDELVSEIHHGRLNNALTITDDIMNKDTIAFSGYVLSIINKLNISLKIKLNPAGKFTPNKYQSISMKSMLIGSIDFSVYKHEKDAFALVNDGIFSSFVSAFILSSIDVLGEVLDESESLTIEDKTNLMIKIPSIIESFLSEIYSHQACTSIEDLSVSTIAELASHYDNGKNCIDFISHSNLYNCIAELNTLISFWPNFILNNYKNIKRFCDEPIVIKRKVLLSISPSRYSVDAKTNSEFVLKITINSSRKIEFYGDLNFDFDYYQALISSLTFSKEQPS